MKLATLKDGSRDGQLAVVSRDLASAHFAVGIASTLQRVLDDWNFLAPQLEDLYATLNGGKARHAFAFDPARCMAPLPRAYRWAAAAGYSSDAGRPRPASAGGLPPGRRDDPTIPEGASDDFLGPHDDAAFASVKAGIDFGAGLAVVTGDVGHGVDSDSALEGVRLLMLVNQWSLRQQVAGEGVEGADLVTSRPATAFGPVAVTPDELGTAWVGGRAHLRIDSHRNGERVGLIDAASGMHFPFGQLIAQLAATRRLAAGSIVGSGIVSHADDSQGFACIADARAQALHGGPLESPLTPYLQFGETVRIAALGRDGSSVFGAIEQRVVAAAA